MADGADDDVARARSAFDRLSEEQRTLVGLCLHAVVDGPFISSDAEFQTVMGVTRKEVAAVAASWPDPAGAPLTFVAVNGTLNNLLGYPHERWPALYERIGVDSRPVVAALAQWRGHELPGSPGRRYFESME